MRRQHGTIEKRNGRFRARASIGEQRLPLGTFATEEEADAALTLFAQKAHAAIPAVGHTVRSWGCEYLAKRELDGVHRAVDKDRHVWKRVDAAAFADVPIVSLTSREIRNWVALQLRTKTERTGKLPGRQTVSMR